MAKNTGGSRGDTAGGSEEYPGNSQAPADGAYETVNLFGRRTGHRVTVQQGDTLPPLPRGYGWVRVEPNPRTET